MGRAHRSTMRTRVGSNTRATERTAHHDVELTQSGARPDEAGEGVALRRCPPARREKNSYMAGEQRALEVCARQAPIQDGAYRPKPSRCARDGESWRAGGQVARWDCWGASSYG